MQSVESWVFMWIEIQTGNTLIHLLLVYRAEPLWFSLNLSITRTWVFVVCDGQTVSSWTFSRAWKTLYPIIRSFGFYKWPMETSFKFYLCFLFMLFSLLLASEWKYEPIIRLKCGCKLRWTFIFTTNISKSAKTMRIAVKFKNTCECSLMHEI